MFFAAHRLRMQLEELKHKSRLELEAQKAEFDRARKNWEDDKKREQSDMKKEHELKLKEVLTLTKLDSEQRIKKAEVDAQSRINAEMEKLNKEFYDKLSAAMTKLHEEGNVTTNFVQELAIKMLGNAPENKTQVKVISSGQEKQTK